MNVQVKAGLELGLDWAWRDNIPWRSTICTHGFRSSAFNASMLRIDRKLQEGSTLTNSAAPPRSVSLISTSSIKVKIMSANSESQSVNSGSPFPGCKVNLNLRRPEDSKHVETPPQTTCSSCSSSTYPAQKPTQSSPPWIRRAKNPPPSSLDSPSQRLLSPLPFSLPLDVDIPPPKQAAPKGGRSP